MNIGKKIMLLRKEKNWSQSDLSKQVGVSREIISKYEKEDVIPSVEVAKKIAIAFGVSLDYLVGNNESDELLKDKNMIRRLKEINELPEKDKDCIIYTLDGLLQNVRTRNAFST